MSSLSLEALANAIGSRIVPDWVDFESSSPWAKLRLLCETLDLEFDRNSEPWSSAKWLCGFRNKVAHGKPEDLFLELVVTEDAYEKELSKYPSSALESQVTLGNAKRAFKTVVDIKLLFFQSLPDELNSGIYSDSAMFSGSPE